MLLKDFERFPEMWVTYVDRRASMENPILELAQALSVKDLGKAEAAFVSLDENFRQTPTGQIARALLDFAKSGQLNEWINTKYSETIIVGTSAPRNNPSGEIPPEKKRASMD